ncbi:MAG TPA: hypothetical protein VMT88_02875, partial [Actinomycetes bacterium]|nr:hypothetical protein [Actinomycetes bacterium]
MEGSADTGSTTSGDLAVPPTSVSRRPTPQVPAVPLPPAHVVEPEMPSRIRRPNDAVRFMAWLTVTALLLV